MEKQTIPVKVGLEQDPVYAQKTGLIDEKIPAKHLSDAEDDNINEDGLTIAKACLFIVGELAGIGALVYGSVIFDIVFCSILLLGVGFIALYSGLKLSQSWTFLTNNDEYYHETKNCKEPYPVLTKVAFGQIGQNISRVSVMITLYFVACIFIIMTSQNCVALLKSFGFDSVCICGMMVLIVVLMTPFTWLPSPKDAWGLAVIAAGSTMIAFALIIGQSFYERKIDMNVVIDKEYTTKMVDNQTYWTRINAPIFISGFDDATLTKLNIAENNTAPVNLPFTTEKMTCDYSENPMKDHYCSPEMQENNIVSFKATYKALFNLPVLGSATAVQFSRVLCKYIFGFGGMSIFPTIQVDMKRAKDFNKVIYLSIGAICASYWAVMAAAYFNFGNLQSNMILSMDKNSWATKTANILMTSHLLTACMLLVNPPMQQLECLLQNFSTSPNDPETNKPPLSKFKSILTRTAFMASLLIFCYTVPSFDPIMMFVSATTIMLNTFILPSCIYLKIVCNVNFYEITEFFDKKKVPRKDQIIMMIVIFLGLYGCVSSLSDLFISLTDPGSSNWISPCFVDSRAVCDKYMGASISH